MKIKNSMPLSPHLGIYKWQINMILSITHRISGVFLYFFLLLTIWFFSLSLVYPDIGITKLGHTFIYSGFGKLFVFGGSFLFYYHLFNGIRHLFWDSGCGFEIKTMQFTSILVLFCSFILAGMTIFAVYF